LHSRRSPSSPSSSSSSPPSSSSPLSPSFSSSPPTPPSSSPSSSSSIPSSSRPPSLSSSSSPPSSFSSSPPTPPPSSSLTSSSSSYKALQTIQDSGLLNHFLPTISVLCYFLPISYVYALYIFQNVIFPTCFRSSNWSFRHGSPSLDLLHSIVFGHVFNMVWPV